MKKIIIILLILLILSGCSDISKDKLFTTLDNTFANYSFNQSHRTNNNTKYYSFYLPSDIQEYEFDDIYHHLKYNGTDFYMNLNVNQILCDRVFMKQASDPFAFIKEYSIYEKNNLSNENNRYKFNLYCIDDKYYFSFFTNKFTFFGTTNTNEIDKLVPNLFLIDDTAKLDYDIIINNYYLGTTIDYVQSNIDLFDMEKPISKEGTLSDLVEIDESSDVQNNVDKNEENS